SAGCQETILHRGTRVTECAHSNVHILKGGKFITAQTDNLILPGISRKRSIRKCYELGIPVLEVAFTLDELFAADEILISSAGTLCAAVKTIDGKPVGGKDPVTLQKIQTALYNEYLDETK
ncbi:MAG: aminotransferase class IV, partial [Christensenellaceae bacterium]|nr:aminotransferase class IV [Christensenellaceae bacterium]